jgi:2-phospho-L-lactate guanylyltransferase
MLQSIHVIIPFKAREGKSRLSSALKPAERRLFAFAMLRDVLAAVFGQGRTPILSTQEFRAEDLGIDVEILQSELELNDALNSLISQEADLDWPADILIVMADLPLLREKEINGILSCQGDVVLCPGRGGGTNMILIRSPKFRTCYHGLSFPEHMAYARKACLNFSVFESFRAGCDIDEPQDLAEVLLHSDGEAKNALEMMGFSLSESGRSIIERHYQKAI